MNNPTKIHNRIEALLTRTGYQIDQENGQRIFHNPANTANVPPRGCEIFVGRLPRDCFEDTLVPLFEGVGPIYKLRLMMDFNGKNRGFCFVTYFRRDIANAAVRLLDGCEVRSGCKIGVFKSLDNTRLFVGGIPVDKTRDDVYSAFNEFVDGIKDVIMYPSYIDQSINRGYVFIEFEDHRSAAIARRRLQPGSLVLWDSNILVDWAEPLPDCDPEVMAKVTKLYCRNISLNLSVEMFEAELGKIISLHHVHKIHKKNDYVFIHFVTRAYAEDAFQKLQGLEIAGRQIEVMWARPEFYSNTHVKHTDLSHFCLSIPAKIRRIIRLRQAAKNKLPPSPFVANNFIFPHHPMAAFPSGMPPPQIAYHPNYYMIHQDNMNLSNMNLSIPMM